MKEKAKQSTRIYIRNLAPEQLPEFIKYLQDELAYAKEVKFDDTAIAIEGIKVLAEQRYKRLAKSILTIQ